MDGNGLGTRMNIMDRWQTIKRYATRTSAPVSSASPPSYAPATYYDAYERLFGQGSFQVYNPSALIGRRGYDILDKMRLDDQVKAAMALKKHAVLGSGWIVESPADQAEDWEGTIFVRKVLGGLQGALVRQLLGIMTALDYGFSVTEKIWAERDGSIVLADLRTRRPHDWTFELDPFGEITVIKQGAREIDRSKLMLYVHAQEFGNPYGQSDLEAAYPRWWVKDNAYRWMAMLLERLGIPPIFALYNPSAYGAGNGAKLAELQTVLQHLQASTVGTVPRGKPEDLDFWTPELADNVANVFIPALEQLDRAISRALLMPGLIGVTSDATEGSLARSRTHFDVFLLVVKNLQSELGEFVQEQLIKPLVDFNFTVDAYPQFSFMPVGDKARLDILAQWEKLVSGGTVTRQPQDETYIRMMLDFPEFDAAVTPSPTTQKETRLKAHRAENRFERRMDFVAMEKDLDDVETRFKSALRSTLQDARKKLLAKVQKVYGPGYTPEAMSLPYTPSVASVIRSFLLEAAQLGVTSARRDIDTTAKPRVYKRAEGEIMKSAEAYIKAKAQVVSDIFTSRVQNKVKSALLAAIRYGDTTREAIERLESVFDEEEGAYLENVARTNITDAVNTGRLEQFRDPDVADYIAAVEYSAIMDTRTTPVCQHLDGKLFSPNDSALTELSPPNHYQCRSVLVPVMVDEDIKEEDFITEGEIGEAKQLMDDMGMEGFK